MTTPATNSGMAGKVSAIKGWQWLALGLLIGLLLGGARIYWEGQSSDAAAVTIAQKEFETLLTAPADQALGAITVYPAHDGFHFVTARQASGRSIVYAAAENYRPKWPETLAGKTLAFRDYLAQSGVGYRYVWSGDWRIRLAAWVGGSVIIIGVIWPAMLMVLIRMGLAPPPPAREPKYDLDRFKSEEPAPTVGIRREIDAKDIEKLRVLEAELERNLRGGMAQAWPTSSAPPSGSVATAGAASDQSSPPTPTSLRPDQRFAATQAEPVVVPEAPKEEKSYGGTFYPTVAHAPRTPSKDH